MQGLRAKMPDDVPLYLVRGGGIGHFAMENDAPCMARRRALHGRLHDHDRMQYRTAAVRGVGKPLTRLVPT